ncbi:MAG: carboxylating nicotinate-nucleotide diphosphorylase [Planctomycetaceae bacterium]
MNGLDLESLRPFLRAALAEDIGSGDVTTDLFVPAGARGRGRIVAKAAGVLAGLPVAVELLRLEAEGDLRVTRQARDGARVAAGESVLEVEAPARALLRATRTALNLLMRLSGIATLTSRYVEAVAGTGAEILDTRKTTPGLRMLEKYAVRAGGGHNHRFGLFDAILVKENHLAFSPNAARALAARPPGVPVIVEAESLDEFRAACEAEADVVLLDEFPPDDVRRARAMRGDAPSPRIEVSGGITLANARSYAEAGAERLSVGAITHSAPALDLSMRIDPVT